MATDALKAHHAKLRDIAGQILSALKHPLPAGNPAGARELLAKLGGILTVHLAAEDQSFYPRLLSDKRREVSELAARFQHEMGGLKEAFGQHMKRWSSEAVSGDTTGFARDTAALMATLGTRMDREEREIYPFG
jgi:hypothetical protein